MHPNNPDYYDEFENWSIKFDDAVKERPEDFEPEVVRASQLLLSGEPLDNLDEVMDIYENAVEDFKKKIEDDDFCMEEDNFYAD